MSAVSTATAFPPAPQHTPTPTRAPTSSSSSSSSPSSSTSSSSSHSLQNLTGHPPPRQQLLPSESSVPPSHQTTTDSPTSAFVPSRQQFTKPIAPWQNAVSGALAGVISRFVIAPLDVVKIRFQLQTSALSPSLRLMRKDSAAKTPQKYTSILQSMALIVREEGIKGLWKGNWSAEYLYLTYGAVQFLTYHEILKRLKTNLKWQDDVSTLAAGGTAGALATLVTYPFDLLRTRFAMQGNEKIYSGLADAIRQIAAKEGPSGFYRGIWPSVIQIVPYMGTMFESHKVFQNMFRSMRESGSWFTRVWGPGTDDFMAGGLAGIVSKTVVMPFDVVRKRLQMQGPDRNAFILQDIPRYRTRGFLATAAQIVRHEGALALYKGLFPGLVKAGPSSAVTFYVVGEMRRGFAAYNEGRAGGNV
ncbi:mitochondrial carrier domain-containing protein [Zopfochytrium polystomum]|nr:mitochondrial carrier domain-containing protein [Zopfochytrium polystomum]